MHQQLTLNEYQTAAHQTARYGEVLEYPFGSLAEEAGEVMGKLNKYCRKHNVPMQTAIVDAQQPQTTEAQKLRVDLIKELGDIQWQLQEAAGVLGMSLQEIAEFNLDKLLGRAERGTLVGEGDDR